MIRKLIILMVLTVVVALLWLAAATYENYYLQNAAYSALALALIYFVFKLVLEEIVARRIGEPRTKYSFKRIISILYVVAFIATGIAIWVENTETLLVSYGVIGAGIAIALQDLFKNIVGGITLFVSNVYRVGDRVEINGKHGDVIDVGLQYTTLFEIQEWISGDQPTGRLILIPNGFLLSSPVHNYTKDHDFIWDEVSIPVTYESDWRLAAQMILHLAEKETAEVTEEARISLLNLSDRYYLPPRAEVPAVYLTPTDNWITVNVRYVTHVRERRAVKNKLSRVILEGIEHAGKVKIASETMEVTVKGVSRTKTE